jgi:DeoR/GlpR family transcriptional regulator of sugar metabolism
MSKNFVYKTTLVNENSGEALIVLKKISQKNGKAKLFKFPLSNIDSVISLLYNTKNDIAQSENSTTPIEIITPILDTIVSLFLSGISVKDLATQYNYSQETIKINLENKGLILFDV